MTSPSCILYWLREVPSYMPSGHLRQSRDFLFCLHVCIIEYKFQQQQQQQTLTHFCKVNLGTTARERAAETAGGLWLAVEEWQLVKGLKAKFLFHGDFSR